MVSRRGLLAAGLLPTPALLTDAARAQPAFPDLPMLADRASLAAARFPPAAMTVRLSGCRSAGDGGGARYRRAEHEPNHPGKIRSADGAWWELCEHRPTPDMFGADGTYEADTPALQACCDYVRANAVYFNPGNVNRANAGPGAANAVYLNARAYRIDRSIDLTDKGELLGLSIIGQGKFASIIAARLDAAYPVIDMSGVSYARLSGVTVITQPGDQSSCCLLLAQVVGCNQHNNAPLIDDCVFTSHFSPNTLATLVMQGGDLAVVQNSSATSLLAPACSYGCCLPALYHGHAVGSGSSTSRIKLNVSGVYDNDPSGLGPAVVGKLVSVNAGPGSGPDQVRIVTAYDAASQTLTLDAPLTAAPSDATRLAILAVKSSFRTLSNLPDNTTARFVGSTFAGAMSFVLRAQGSFTASGCYFTADNAGAVAVMVMDDYLFSQTEHVVQLLGGCRFEDNSHRPDIHGFLSYNQVVRLEIDGVIDINAPRGAQIACARGGSIQNLSYLGEADNQTPLLHLVDAAGKPSGMQTVQGIAKWQALGVVGPVRVWTLQNIAQSGAMSDAVAAVALSGAFQGTDILQRRARLSGVAGALSHVLELQNFDVARQRTTGGGSQKRMSWIIQAGALRTGDPGLRPRLHAEFAGACLAAVSAFGVQIAQAAPAPLAGQRQSAALSAGASWRLVLDIMRLGSGWVWSGALWDGPRLANSFQGGLPPFNDGADLSIELYEHAASANASDVTTYFAQLS